MTSEYRCTSPIFSLYEVYENLLHNVLFSKIGIFLRKKSLDHQGHLFCSSLGGGDPSSVKVSEGTWLTLSLPVFLPTEAFNTFIRSVRCKLFWCWSLDVAFKIILCSISQIVKLRPIGGLECDFQTFSINMPKTVAAKGKKNHINWILACSYS